MDNKSIIDLTFLFLDNALAKGDSFIDFLVSSLNESKLSSNDLVLGLAYNSANILYITLA